MFMISAFLGHVGTPYLWIWNICQITVKFQDKQESCFELLLVAKLTFGMLEPRSLDNLEVGTLDSVDF